MTRSLPKILRAHGFVVLIFQGLDAGEVGITTRVKRNTLTEIMPTIVRMRKTWRREIGDRDLIGRAVKGVCAPSAVSHASMWP